MFRAADLVVLTKTDLLPHLPDVEIARIHDALGRVAPEARVIEVSATRGEGLDAWLAWVAHWRPDARSASEIDAAVGT
jgi:hydrogenase nickel incorporation protein HypB